MELLTKIGQVCRQHYEKLLLTLALLGLGIAVVYLNDESKREAEKIKEFLQRVDIRAKSNIKTVDFSAYEAAMRQAESPPVVNFSLPHNLFNPVKWQRRPNNELIKVQTGREVGWEQVSLGKVTPLTFTINLVKAPSASGAFFGFTKEAAEKVYERRTRQIFFTLNATNRFLDKAFVMRELKGAPENPEAVMELVDSNEKVTIGSSKPYVKVEGYEAELKYNVEGKTFPNLRVGSTLRFLGEAYNIIAITPDEVVASAQLNDKKYSVRK